MQPAASTIYLAPEGFLPELLVELGDASVIADRLVEARGPARPVAWAQNVWLEPQRIPIASITDAAHKLKALQRNWALWSTTLHRRAALIAAALPKVSSRPLAFPAAPPTSPLGSWTLGDERTLIAAPRSTSPFVHGEPRFIEDKVAPPNRAYLKLWEALTSLGVHPRPGERCVDLGASPGGWTWVVATLGAEVLAVDRAPLAPNVSAMPGVTFEQRDAFALTPESVGQVDWLFCDVIAFPEKSYELVSAWLASGRARRIVCSVKFKGETDMRVVERFKALPGGSLRHLFHNKHELTFMATRS